MKILMPFWNLILIGFGITMTFYGARFMFQAIGLILAVFVTSFLFMMSYNLFLPHDNLWLLGFFLFICAFLGGYVSYISYSFAKTWGVSLISAWAGLAVGLIIAKVFFDNATLTLLTAIAASLTSAYLGKKLNVFVKSFGTAIFGSYCIIKGIGGYAGGLPKNIFTGSEHIQQVDLDYKAYLYISSFVLLAVFGSKFQSKSMKAKSDDDYSMEQDEGCAC